MSEGRDLRVPNRDEFEYEDEMDELADHGRGGGSKRTLGRVGALALLVVFGIGVWYAYDQGMQKGAKLAPPLIAAEDTPAKVAPEDPGGMEIPNRDKQVYGMLEGREGEEVVEQLLPPPEQPSAEQEPAETAEGQMEPAAGDAQTGEDAAAGAGQQDGAQSAETAAATIAENATRSDGGGAQDAGSMQSGAKEAVAGNTAAKESAQSEPVKVASKPSVQAAAKPQAKPAAVSGGSGSYRVQLGAFSTRDSAMTGWERIRNKVGGILAGVSPHIAEIKISGKGTLHRLQAGAFSADADARQLCERLKAQKQACLVVRQ